GRRVLRIVEPKPQVERVRWGQADVGIEAEDLIEENRPDLDRAAAVSVDVDVGLIPGEPKVREGRIHGAIRQQVASLDGEEVEDQVRLDIFQLQEQCVVDLAALDLYVRPRRTVWITGKLGEAGEELGSGRELEGDRLRLPESRARPQDREASPKEQPDRSAEAGQRATWSVNHAVLLSTGISVVVLFPPLGRVVGRTHHLFVGRST